eukprot:6280327-Amphidinium_carterae.1
MHETCAGVDRKSGRSLVPDLRNSILVQLHECWCTSTRAVILCRHSRSVSGQTLGKTYVAQIVHGVARWEE